MIGIIQKKFKNEYFIFLLVENNFLVFEGLKIRQL